MKGGTLSTLNVSPGVSSIQASSHAKPARNVEEAEKRRD